MPLATHTQKEENAELLHKACKEKNLQAVGRLLRSGTDVNAQIGCSKATPLHLVAQNSDVLIAKLLLVYGAKINATNFYKNTPLHLAVQNGKEAMVELLLENKAEVDLNNNSIETPLYLAVQNGDETITKLLLLYEADITLLHHCAKTSLYIAVKNDCITIAELLLQRTIAEPLLQYKNYVNVKGYTPDGYDSPIHIAVKNGNKDMVKLLLRYGAKINATNSYEYTALHIAAKKGDKGMAKLLLENKAEVNEEDYCGYTALHIAAKKGDVLIGELLLQYNADLNAKDYKSNIPIYYAAKANSIPLVVKMLEAYCCKTYNTEYSKKIEHNMLILCADKIMDTVSKIMDAASNSRTVDKELYELSKFSYHELLFNPLFEDSSALGMDNYVEDHLA